MPFLDPGLYGFCTDRQREVLEAINREVGFRAAARHLGCHLSFPSKVLKDVKRKAAARDAYAARGGWFSERSATAITYDLDHGRVQSNTVTAEMFS